MADPLSMAASIAGVVTLAVSTARTLLTLASEIRDAPEEIIHVRRDVQNLGSVLRSLESMTAKADLGEEDRALTESLTEYLCLCQTTMEAIADLLKGFTRKGSGRRSPMRMLGWTMRKGEIRALRARLQEGKASLNITISALNGVIEGKAQEEIKADVNKVYEQLIAEFQNLETGRRVRRKAEDDVASISTLRRRKSISDSTDAGLPLRRYFEQDHDNATLEPASAERPVIWPSPSISLLPAARARNKQLLEELIAQGCAIDERSPEGLTALHFCAIYNDVEMALVLVDHGADINTRDNQLRSPFQVALASEATKVAALLAERGCSLGNSAGVIFDLMKRADEVPGLPDLLRMLAARLKGASPGMYPIHQVIRDDDSRSLEMLCDAGFDIQSRDVHDGNIQWQKKIRRHCRVSGITPLAVATGVLRDTKMTKFLLDNGADPNFEYPDGGILIMGACAEEYLEMAKILVEGGSDVNHKNFAGHCGLYWATRCDNPPLLRFMLEHGGDVNFTDNGGYTLLHLAAMDGHTEAAMILLEYKADLGLKTRNGHTASKLARAHKHWDIAGMIESSIKTA
ncbi:ankyrin [Xylariales sp. AK1849]|nr:ankyrin [Xylariales sp. AK1849]